MRFQGLKAPQLNVPLIELESPEGKFTDLYNEHELVSVELSGGALTFSFVSVYDPSSSVVQFQGVRNLRVTQPEDWALGEADQIERLLIRPDGPWPAVTFKAGGCEYEFDCGVMVLTSSRTVTPHGLIRCGPPRDAHASRVVRPG